MNGKHLDWNLIHGKCNEWYLLQIIAIILLAGQSFLVFSCNSEIVVFILCSFTKLYPLMRNTSVLMKICFLLSEDMIVNSHSLLVKCVVVRINNVWNWSERWGIVVLNMWSVWVYILQALILPCIFLSVWLICYVSVFLIVYCWTLIIFKWFISYDDGFCFVC